MEKNFEKKLQIAMRSLAGYKLPPVKTGIILGSGLGDFVDQWPGISIPYARIKGFPPASVRGHKGLLKIGGQVAVCAGRFHLYEGYTADEVVLPVFLLKNLGIRRLILTNAAGGINPTFTPGDLVLIRDHLNLTGINPLRGPHLSSFGPRFPDSSDIYSRQLRTRLQEQQAETLKEGIYAAMPGPSYETPAEIKMLQKLGADMVGMSTVPEALAASCLGLEVLGISCITNMAAGIGAAKLDHADVIATGKQTAAALGQLLKRILEQEIL